MSSVKITMINDYKIKKIGFDFMGYTFERNKELSYHHLIIPKREGGKVTRENGAILVQETSHNYLHKIELIDWEIFDLLTLEMVDENLKGKLDIVNLKKIRDLLEYFEKEHCGDTNRKGMPIIKEEYIKRRIKL